MRQSLRRLPHDEQRLIEERVRSLLKAAGVEEPPTPREAIITCAKMVEAGEIDLDDFRESIIERGLRKLIEGLDFEAVWRKVRGLFRYDDRVFYVDPNQHPHQQVHATFHEAYHAIDPAHKEMSELIHLDNDQTLAPWAKKKMEMEANLGASLIRFQLNRLQKEARDFPVSMETIVYLAQRFDASIHSTLRRYVEDIDELCMMLVFDQEPRMTPTGDPYYTLRYHLASTKFEERFSTSWPRCILPDHWIFTAINDALPNKPSLHEWCLTDFHDNDIACVTQCFHNRYHILALIYPKRKAKSKGSVLSRIGYNGPTGLTKLGNRGSGIQKGRSPIVDRLEGRKAVGPDLLKFYFSTATKPTPTFASSETKPRGTQQLPSSDVPTLEISKPFRTIPRNRQRVGLVAHVRQTAS